MSVRGPRIDTRSRWVRAARIGQTWWLCGNAYEALVGVPRLLADARAPRAGSAEHRQPDPLLRPRGTAGSRRHGGVLADVARHGGARRVAGATAGATTLVAVAVSGYLVRTVNLRLLRSRRPVDLVERRRLTRTWHRANLVRSAALVASMAAFPARDA